MQNIGIKMEMKVNNSRMPLLSRYQFVRNHQCTGVILSQIPDVLVKEVFSGMAIKDQVSFAHTSKYWHNYVSESRAVEMALAKSRMRSFKKFRRFLIIYDITNLVLPIIASMMLYKLPLAEKNKSYFIMQSVNAIEVITLVFPCSLSIYEYGYKGIPQNYLIHDRWELNYEFKTKYPYVNAIMIGQRIVWSIILLGASDVYQVKSIANLGRISGSLILCRHALGRRVIHNLLDKATSLFDRIAECFKRCRNRNRQEEEEAITI